MASRASRVTTVVAALSATAGLSVIVHGMARSDLARTLGGVSFTTVTLTLITLTAIRRWITDTQVERMQLSEAIRSANDERTRYIAAQASLEMERQRLSRDAAADRARTLAMLEAERAKMAEVFEERRAQLVCDAMEEGVKLMHQRAADEASEQERARIINFPKQEAERARSRDVQ